MMSEILNTWKEIAAFLKVSVAKAQRMAIKHPDFPLFRDGRIFTTTTALEEWITHKALANSIDKE